MERWKIFYYNYCNLLADFSFEFCCVSGVIDRHELAVRRCLQGRVGQPPLVELCPDSPML